MSKSAYASTKLLFEFLATPKLVLARDDYKGLPSSAKALMLDVMSLYTGKNNGRLCIGMEAMRARGWNSKAKLLRAKKALLECEFVVQTRMGRPPQTAEWIGFTWWKLNWDESMDIKDPTVWTGAYYLNFLFTGSALPPQPENMRIEQEIKWKAQIAKIKAAREKAKNGDSVVPKQDHAETTRRAQVVTKQDHSPAAKTLNESRNGTTRHRETTSIAIGPESGEVLEDQSPSSFLPLRSSVPRKAAEGVSENGPRRISANGHA